MSAAVQRLLAVAGAEVGYVEGRGNRTKYGLWYGMDGEPWCAMYVSWCAAHAGIPPTVIPRHAYTPTGANWFRRRGLWRDTPAPGDIAYYDIGLGRISHVGIVERVHGRTVTTIEGNTDARGGRTGGRVMRRTRPTRGGIVAGYGRPAYGSAPVRSPIREVTDMSEAELLALMVRAVTAVLRSEGVAGVETRAASALRTEGVSGVADTARTALARLDTIEGRLSEIETALGSTTP